MKQSKKIDSWKPEAPYVPNSLKMRQSEAWRSLDHNTKKFLERLEIEHMLHGGKDNGRLPCTYNDLVEYGIHRELIPPSIRRAVTCGFVEITRRGRKSAAGGNPTLYRLTYLPAFNGTWPTNEWKNYRSGGFRKVQKSETKIQNVGTENRTLSSTENRTVSVRKTVLKAPKTQQKATVRKTVLLSRISSHLSGPLGQAEEEGVEHES